MIVIDTSIVVELVLATPDGFRIQQEIATEPGPVVAPELLDLEVLQVLRRQLRLGKISAERARAAVEALRVLPVKRMQHAPLLARIWELRDNLTAYDAAFIALAEWLGAPCWTRDLKFRNAPHQAITIIR